MKIRTKHTNNPLTFGLAMAAGIGMILMLAALAGGVLGDGDVGMLFAFGLILMVIGIGGWIIATQPHAHFDDINQPLYTGHHHEPHHAADEAHGHELPSTTDTATDTAHH